MSHNIQCPSCGQMTLKAKNHCIQEIDPVICSFKSPELLLEFECQLCGWLATAPGTAA